MKQKVGQFRNLTNMPGSSVTFQFEVKLKDGTWKLLTNLGGESDQDRREFAQKTANDWIKR
jgi:hypothetical protein